MRQSPRAQLPLLDAINPIKTSQTAKPQYTGSDPEAKRQSRFILIAMDTLWTPWRYAYVAAADRPVRQGVPVELDLWPGDKHCVFCNLLAAADYAIAHGMNPEQADRAARIVLRTQHCYICLNIFPYTSGHVMIVPRRHEPDLAGLEPAEAGEMMTLAQQSELVLRSTYSPDGINAGMNLGKAAGAGVAGHLHMHMLPRWAGDTNFMTVLGETRVLPEALDTTWEKLRAAFAP